MRASLLIGLGLLFTAILGLFLAYRTQTTRRDAAVPMVTTEVQPLRAENDSLRSLLQASFDEEEHGRFWYQQMLRARENQGMLLTEAEIGRFRDLGLHDPADRLRDDLMAHPELIPQEGVLGGTMRFMRDGIALLSPRWAYATYEDGHISGDCLLEYEVEPGGRITWRVIASALD